MGELKISAEHIAAEPGNYRLIRLPERLGIGEEMLKAVDDGSMNDLVSYFHYVCDDTGHKPFIPANLIIRAECASDAVSFAKRLIKTEEKKREKNILIKECKEDNLSGLKVLELAKAKEDTVMLVSGIREEKPEPAEIRKRTKSAGTSRIPWDEYGSELLEYKNIKSRIIVCTSYKGACNFLDECADEKIKSSLMSVFNYDIRLRSKNASEITAELIGMLGRRYLITSYFSDKLTGYIRDDYPESPVRGSAYAEYVFNRIVKEKYRHMPGLRHLSACCIPHIKRAGTAEQAVIKSTDSFAEINSLTGLANVKKLLKELEGFCRLNAAEARDMYLNFVFTGNPGTGKTTVAHMMANMLCSMGVIKNNKVVEITPLQLIGHYIGDAALYVKDACERASGGILFIDEAYGLNPKEAAYNLKACKEDALALLLKAMDNNRENLTVIFAGYGDEMNQMLEANPGIKSRIYKNVEFEDYSETELLEIFKAECDKAGYSYSEAALRKAEEKLRILRYDESFGNARTVKTVFQEACLAHLEEDPEMKDRVLKPEHIVIDSKLPDFESSREKLEGLTGLETVKRSVDEIAALCRYNAHTGKAAVPSAANMLFRGNPGTGKTTVAELFGNMLFALGAVKAPRFVSINAYELNTSLVGGVSKKLRAYCKKAMGGVLFIDEAYGIGEFTESSASDAISVLLDMMENHREDLVIIFAGYSDKMREFFGKNPGLRSRVPLTLDFEDYSLEELEEIFAGLCEKNGFRVTDEAMEIVRETLAEAMGRDDFANARTVRNIFEKAYKNHAVRLMDTGRWDEENVINEEDMDMDGITDGTYTPMGFC